MEPKVEEKGRLFIVDPNPPGSKGLEQIPPEDLFIYVKFTATPRSRLGFADQTTPIEGGVIDEINFISSEIRYSPDGKLDPETQKTFATTNWTGIGGESSSGGVLEGFGIKSIDIKYNASLVPVVDITFTDVRGAGLFDTIKDNDRQSPYSIFFKMPYPIFKLSVKGYFGQSVEYCLHMVNWNSNFDGSTGNFDITANFLGFQQAFLNDMNIGNIVANVNTTEGERALSDLQWTFKDSKGNDFTIPGGTDGVRKIDQFFLKISRLQVDAEKFKVDSIGFDELKDLGAQLKLLKEIQGFIGSPIGKDSTDSTDEGYLNKNNNTITIKSNAISDKSSLKFKDNYLSIRDYLIINTINVAAFKSFITTLTNAVNQYNKFIKDFKDKDGNPFTVNSDDFTDAFLTTDNYVNYVDQTTKNGLNVSGKKLRSILVALGDIDNELSLTKDFDDGNNNNGFNIKNYNNEKFKFYTPTMSAETSVFVVDFRKQRATVEDLILTLTEDIAKKKKIVTDELNKKLTDNFINVNKFAPTIENCFRILANNTQALTTTIWSISRAAEKSDFNSRNGLLSQNNCRTDIPPSIETSVAWPAIYRNNTDGSSTEIYVGELGDDADQYFPEMKYIEEIYSALVAKQKSLSKITKASLASNILDQNNWFPINPLDYDENPFVEFNTTAASVEKDLINTLANRFILRLAVLDNYSKFNDQTGLAKSADYYKLDGLNANLTITNPKTREVMLQKLKNADNLYNEFKKTKFFIDNIIEESDILKITSAQKIGSFNIGGLDDGVNYIDFDTNAIINNSKNLYKEISDDKNYKNLGISTKIKKEEKGDKSFLIQKYYNNNLTDNILYNVWDETVSKKLYDTNNKNQSTLSITEITDVNISAKTESDKGKYLNKTNFIKPSDNEIQFSGRMTDSVLYKSQKDVNAKGLLLLSTIPFKPFKTAVLDAVFGGEYNGARILNLPEYYIYLIGGYLWRYKEDKLLFDGINAPFSTPKGEYLTKLGYLATTDVEKVLIEPELLNLPTSTKDTLIFKFTNWVTTKGVAADGSGKFETYMKNYYSDIPAESDIGANSLTNELEDTTKMIIFTPSIFDETLPKKLTVNKSEVINYIQTFATAFTKMNENNVTGKNDDVNDEKNFKIKLAIYNYFKNVNDKWVSSTEKIFSVCGDNSIDDPNKNLIDYFKFIDRGWRDIGQEAVFNLNSFLNLGNEFKTSVYFFMSKLLRDSNFLFQILPTHIDFKDAEEVAKIFKPVTLLENNKSSGPLYACIYVGGASRVLDIQDRDYGFENDTFSFSDVAGIPSEFTDEEIQEQKEEKLKKKKNSQVAFRVAFGAENQSIFKNVSLNQQEHKETAEYFKALSDLVDKRGGTQKSYQGTDLYKIYNTRSYTCKVDALGCMNIQPLMYFDLQNVPFFKGAYLITNVNHSITPNHMTTNFQGLRQSKFIAPPPKEITADLKLNLDETRNTKDVLDFEINSSNDKYTIGVITPDGGFDFEKFTVDNFVNKFGVPATVATTSNLSKFSELCDENGIKSNKQVCMLLANILTVSSNMTNLKKPLVLDVLDSSKQSPVFDESTSFSGLARHYGTNPPETFSPFFETYKDAAGTISAITPTFTSTTADNNFKNTISMQNPFVTSVEAYPGDAWLFRPRGYLYVTGRQEYFDSAYAKPNFTNPWKLSLFPDEAFAIAVDVWKNKRISNKEGTYEAKTAFEICQAGKGGANIYTRTFTITGNDKEIDLYFQNFEKVLLAFNLKKDFQLE